VPAGYKGTSAWRVSADGTIAVGNLQLLAGGFEAGRWTEATGWVGLGDLDGGRFFSFVSGVSGDGSLVVGHSSEGSSPAGRGMEAFVWDAVHGMRNLADLLRNEYGLSDSLSNWDLYTAYDISDDGRMIVGEGTAPDGTTNQPWVAYLGDSSADPQ
jgi:uncharacterized membrane protein